MAETMFDHAAVEEALDRMSEAMRADKVWLIGIQRGGSLVADQLQKRLEAMGCKVARGNLDISFYRDDLDTIGPNPEVRPTRLPFDLNDKPLWLIDDVLYTGRTIRAALGEIFDYGRPAAVKLAVLVDRGGRQLPIQADVAGLTYIVQPNQSVKLFTGGEWEIVLRQVRA